MSHDPCHHDCSDFSDDEATRDHGCCAPIPVRRDCARPVLPVPECDEEDATMEFDPETEEFLALGKLYDTLCSAISDENNSVITTAIG